MTEKIELEVKGEKYEVELEYDDFGDGFEEMNEPMSTVITFGQGLGKKHEFREPFEFLATLIDEELPKTKEALKQEIEKGMKKKWKIKKNDEGIYEVYDHFNWLEEEAETLEEAEEVMENALEDAMEDNGEWENFIELNDLIRLIEESEEVTMLPVYMSKHGGETINTVGFSDPWDSGQIGHVYIKSEDAEKELSVDAKTEEGHKKIEETMRMEIEEMDKYVKGEVYRLIITEEEGGGYGVGGLLGEDGVKEYLVGEFGENMREKIENEIVPKLMEKI